MNVEFIRRRRKISTNIVWTKIAIFIPGRGGLNQYVFHQTGDNIFQFSIFFFFTFLVPINTLWPSKCGQYTNTVMNECVKKILNPV